MTEKTERMISHFHLAAVVFVRRLFGLIILNVHCFFPPFSYNSALVTIMFVWLAECTEGRVKECVRVCVCRVVSCACRCGFIIGVVGFVFHYF